MSNEKRKCLVICLLALFIGLIGIVLPEITFTPKQYINASNITVVGAGATSGSLQNISDINQGYFNITEGNAQPFYAIVNFTGVTNFSFVEIKAKYFSSSVTPSSHTVDLEIYCTTDNEYEDLFFLENTDSWRYFTRHFPDDMHFIDNQGNVSIKFNHAANGNVNHRLWVDTVRLITSSQYEQININQTIIQGGGTGSQNLSQVLQQGNNAGVNDLDMNNNTIQNMLGMTRFGTKETIYLDGLESEPEINIDVANATSSIDININAGLFGSYLTGGNYFELNQRYFEVGQNLNVIKNITMNGNLTGCLNCDTNLATKVNKTGDTMNGNLNVYANISTNGTGVFTVNKTTPYTGSGTTMLEFGRTSHESKFRATLNDLNGAYNFRVNSKDDVTQDNTTGAGYSLAFQPWINQDQIYFIRVIPGTTTTENLLRIFRNDSMSYGPISGGNPSNFTVYRNGSIISNPLAMSGTGNYSIVIADSTGKLIAVPMNGSGNHYICANGAGLPYPGTPGC